MSCVSSTILVPLSAALALYSGLHLLAINVYIVIITIILPP
jgi:hypothetical protein